MLPAPSQFPHQAPTGVLPLSCFPPQSKSQIQTPPPPPICSKSQIQTFLEQNEGAGLQHMALKTDDIVATMRQMRAR